MPKRLTDNQKKDIKELFINGKSINSIASTFNFSVQTITRQLKILFGETEFKKIKTNSIKEKINSQKHIKKDPLSQRQKDSENSKLSFPIINEESYEQPFVEIKPLSEHIEFETQKDISSKPLNSVKLPKILYMLVENNIELAPKFLKEYPEWSFLPKEDLDRTTIEIFSDQKIAKRNCKKNQKLIKIPNPEVFLIASSHLKSKGISRIVFDNLLLSL